jgi:hypothetical protein
MSIKNWWDLRLILMEYGKQFVLRYQLFLSFALVTILVDFIVLILIHKRSTRYMSIIIVVLLPLVFLPYLFTFANLVVGTAKVNSYFGRHIGVLKETLLVVNNIYILYDTYLKGMLRSQNYVYYICIEKLKKDFDIDKLDFSGLTPNEIKLKWEENLNRVRIHLQDIVTAFKYEIKQIEYDQGGKQATLFGYVITTELLDSLTALISAAIIPLATVYVEQYGAPAIDWLTDGIEIN